jgi:hypothetical protein
MGLQEEGVREVKGEAPSSIAIFLREKFGEEGFKQWLDSISPESRRIYSAPILTGSWYPLKEALVEPLARLCQLFYDGNLKGAREAGRFCAEHGLKGVFDVFVKGGSVETLIQRGSVVIAAYYKPPPNAQIDGQKGHGLLKFTEFPEISRYDEHFLAGWVEQAFELLGCKEVKVEVVKSITRGDPSTEWGASWK